MESENKKQFLFHYRRRIYRPGAEELLEWLKSTNFFQVPTREGGLVEHSLHVYKRLRRLFMLEYTDGDIPYPEQDETIAICGLLHDIGKINVYRQESGKNVFCGHGEKSVYTISRLVKLTKEETMAIQWHMGLMDNDSNASRDSIENIFKQYPLAVLTHTADLQATYLDGTKGAGK